jgi:hypothetical protein
MYSCVARCLPIIYSYKHNKGAFYQEITFKHCHAPKGKQVVRISSKKCRKLSQEQIKHIYQGFNGNKRVTLIGVIIS